MLLLHLYHTETGDKQKINSKAKNMTFIEGQKILSIVTDIVIYRMLATEKERNQHESLRHELLLEIKVNKY